MAESNITDEEILEQWYPQHNFERGTKFCSAARKFLAEAGQWPWEWCVHDLSPKQWGPALVQDLARLAETYNRSGKNLNEAKLPLIRAMKRRKTTDKKNYFLDQRDVNKVINEFQPQHSSPSNGTTEDEHKRLNPVNKTIHEPSAVAKPTTSKQTSGPGSSRGPRVTTESPERSTARGRMTSSINSVQSSQAEPRLFMGSPMSMPERALSVMRLMSEMPLLPDTNHSPDLSTPRARMATSTIRSGTPVGSNRFLPAEPRLFMGSPMPMPERALSVMWLMSEMPSLPDTNHSPDLSTSRARMVTSTHPVETELGPFVSSPMSEEGPEPETPLPTMPTSEPVPETTDTQMTIRIPTLTHVPEQELGLETTSLPEATDGLETTYFSEPEEIIGMFDTMEMPESMNMSDSMDMRDTMYLPEITGVPQTTDMSETPHPADTMPETMNMPQTTAIPETTHMANTTSVLMDVPEPESVPGTTVMPEADPTAEEATVTEDIFPMEHETCDSKRGIFWDQVFEPQSSATRNKKRPSSSPTLPPKKRARGSIYDLKAELPHRPDGHTTDGIRATLSEMRYHEITLQKRLSLRLAEQAAFQDSTRSYTEQQALASLESKIECLHQSIQQLERDRVPIKERLKEWEKLRSVMLHPDTAKPRGLDEANRRLQQNTTAILNAKKTLQQTIEALDRQKAAREKLATTVEDNLNEIGDQVMAWDALMRLVNGFPASVERVNAVLKMQERCLEEIACCDDKYDEEEEDDSGIDEPLINTPDLPDLADWDSLDGSTALAKAPLHNDI